MKTHTKTLAATVLREYIYKNKKKTRNKNYIYKKKRGKEIPNKRFFTAYRRFLYTW